MTTLHDPAREMTRVYGLRLSRALRAALRSLTLADAALRTVAEHATRDDRGDVMSARARIALARADVATMREAVR